MARAHPVATVVIDATEQQRLGPGARSRVIVQLFAELGLNRIEEITVDDGWLLAVKDLALEGNLPNVEPVAQEIGEGTAGEWDPSDCTPGLERSRERIGSSITTPSARKPTMAAPTPAA